MPNQLGKILEVRVALGKVETVMKQDRTRRVPSQGFDAIFVSKQGLQKLMVSSYGLCIAVIIIITVFGHLNILLKCIINSG